MRHALVTTLENTPVIPAVKTPEELPRGACAPRGAWCFCCVEIF